MRLLAIFYSHLLAEMFAYCLAAAHLNLPHQVVWSFMISDVGSPDLEGWALLDKYSKRDVCTPGSIPQKILPHVLHYCHRYTLGKFVIGKHRVPNDFISCESPLFTEPPPDLGEKYDFYIEPDKDKDIRTNINPKHIKDHAFMLCTILPSFNAAAMYYKNHYCQDAPFVNTNKVLCVCFFSLSYYNWFVFILYSPLPSFFVNIFDTQRRFYIL